MVEARDYNKHIAEVVQKHLPAEFKNKGYYHFAAGSIATGPAMWIDDLALNIWYNVSGGLSSLVQSAVEEISGNKLKKEMDDPRFAEYGLDESMSYLSELPRGILSELPDDKLAAYVAHAFKAGVGFLLPPIGHGLLIAAREVGKQNMHAARQVRAAKNIGEGVQEIISKSRKRPSEIRNIKAILEEYQRVPENYQNYSLEKDIRKYLLSVETLSPYQFEQVFLKGNGVDGIKKPSLNSELQPKK